MFVTSNTIRHFIVVELSFSKGRYFWVGRYFREVGGGGGGGGLLLEFNRKIKN